ncbi:hypothetical protein AU210_016325 [Fusarium oxysporum f. sp. radicis-cucumerinum]|uniref:Uncharacterized protein n=1 Tax=Fusarium oxysporum f. sp. radicis-cucumerinum TaxID=327505 RepID=A0A2H3FSJ9_FUSOX|nr:hypothetical protein AU210_016325 [Fusarium oxysporum f. sp. radicis-cucumerinum]
MLPFLTGRLQICKSQGEKPGAKLKGRLLRNLLDERGKEYHLTPKDFPDPSRVVWRRTGFHPDRLFPSVLLFNLHLTHFALALFVPTPKKEFQKQRPGQVIEKAFKSMSPCEAKDLDELDDAQLVSIFRSRLKQRAALAFASLDSPVVMNEGLGSPQGAPDTILDPGNETENRNNPVPFLESNARASPIQQGPWSAAHSPAVAQSDCTIFEQVESVDRTPASSAVEPPSPSFSLPGDGQVNLDSGSASPPEDDAQDPSFGPSTCEDEGSQPLYSRNDGLSNGSDAPPDQARPDTISYVERLPSSVAARTTTDPSHGKPIETSKDGIANPAKRKRKGDSQVNKETSYGNEKALSF